MYFTFTSAAYSAHAWARGGDLSDPPVARESRLCVAAPDAKTPPPLGPIGDFWADSVIGDAPRMTEGEARPVAMHDDDSTRPSPADAPPLSALQTAR